MTDSDSPWSRVQTAARTTLSSQAFLFLALSSAFLYPLSPRRLLSLSAALTSSLPIEPFRQPLGFSSFALRANPIFGFDPRTAPCSGANPEV